MQHSRIFLAALLAFAVTSTGVSKASIIEVGDLNIIDEAGNPSDGLAFLDMTFSDGLSLAAALANAQASYAGARLATPAEFDDLFAAAGVTYSSSVTAADGFTAGPNAGLASNSDSGVAVLRSALGPTAADRTDIWTDPDGVSLTASTRDYLSLDTNNAAWVRQLTLDPPSSGLGWLVVVPEPSTFSMVALGALALGLRRRRAAVR